MLAGGERGGVTLTSDENAGCIFVSVKLPSEDFLDLEGNFSFLAFFSGGTEEVGGDLTDSCWPTTPMTDTLVGSTSSEVSSVGVAVSDFRASRFSFFNLQEGVDI